MPEYTLEQLKRILFNTESSCRDMRDTQLRECRINNFSNRSKKECQDAVRKTYEECVQRAGIAFDHPTGSTRLSGCADFKAWRDAKCNRENFWRSDREKCHDRAQGDYNECIRDVKNNYR